MSNRCSSSNLSTGEASTPARHPLRFRLFTRFLAAIGAVVFLWLLLPTPRSEALDLLVELSTGNDSNPALNDRSDGSWFSVYALEAMHPFAISEDLVLDVSVEGRYQDYWSVSDNYSSQASTELSEILAEGRFILSLLAAVSADRDSLIEADERNGVMVGISTEWILSTRLTLGFEQTYQWMDYLNRTKPFSGKGQGLPDGKGKNRGKDCSPESPCKGAGHPAPGVNASGQDHGLLNKLYPARDNRMMVTGLNLEIFLRPSLSGCVYASYGDLDASLDMESYGEIKAGALLFWVPAARWRVEIEAGWYRTEYHNVPDNITNVRRTNITRSAGVQISRFWRDVEIYGVMGWKAGDIPLDHESFTRTLFQCGISYSF